MNIQSIDARGLEPPEPLIRILTAFEELKPGDTLAAHTDRNPIHLLDLLAQRGCHARCEEKAGAGWVTTIRK